MRKHLFALAFFCMLFLFAAPETALATDANSDGYCDEDVAAIDRLIESNGLGWAKGEPESWPTGSDAYTQPNTVEWETGENNEKRITALNLSQNTALHGELDFSGLTELGFLECSHLGVTALDLSDQAKLTQLRCIESDIGKLDLTRSASLRSLECFANHSLTELKISGLANLQYLECSTTAITDLDLSGLINLRHLGCGGTDITALDLDGLTQLEALNCYSTDITELALSALSNLRSLNCSGTDITMLELSGLTQLETLSCSDTGVTELDLSALPNLRSLNCSNTGVTELDLSVSPNLRELFCNSTPIRELDVAALTGLHSLWCDSTGIVELDVGNLTSLETLNCSRTGVTELDLGSLSALQSLYCDNTALTELDLSGLTQLEILYCAYTPITKLVLSGLTQLQSLHCNNTALTELDLSGLTNLTRLDCAGTYERFTSPAGHVLTLQKRGGGGGIRLEGYGLTNQSVVLHADATLPQPPEGDADWYIFAGWEELPEDAAVQNGVAASFILDENTTVTAAFVQALRGDMDRDGQIGLADAVLLARCLVGSTAYTDDTQERQADANGDRTWDVRDVQAVCGVLVNGGSLPKLPFIDVPMTG